MDELVKANTARIKGNVRKMIDQGAPDREIGTYVAAEGATPEILRGIADYKASDVLNFLASLHPEISRPHLRKPDVRELLIVFVPALLVWLFGRACRYVLAGT